MNISDIESTFNEAKNNINLTSDLESLDNIRVAMLGKKGVITAYAKSLKDLSLDDKKKFSPIINKYKNELQNIIDNKKKEIENNIYQEKLAQETIDITIPNRTTEYGKIHPISKVTQDIIKFFTNMGFEVKQGPEVEEQYYNFEALNIPENHPARQMQDTFYIEDEEEKKLLRTHTSPVQIRTMLSGKAPFKIISTGRVFRSDSDLTHTPMFNQVEGLLIDENINMGHLKYIIKKFIQYFFGIENIPIRFRPSFFPFTEPSAEVDIGCKHINGEIEIDNSGENWLEILGCGMVHPNVLKNVGIDGDKYQGFAFGMGIERMAMLKYGINDLRQFFNGDLRWLKHYGFSFFSDYK